MTLADWKHGAFSAEWTTDGTDAGSAHGPTQGSVSGDRDSSLGDAQGVRGDKTRGRAAASKSPRGL